MKTQYIAADGKVFDDEFMCELHERKYCKPNPHVVCTVTYKIPVPEMTQHETIELMKQLRETKFVGPLDTVGSVEVNFNKFGK